METLKIIAITGMVMVLVNITASASGEKATTAAETKLKMENTSDNKALEMSLIEEFLKEQALVEADCVESTIKIFNLKDELVYQGNPNAVEATTLKFSAEFVMETEGISYYLLFDH